MQKKTVTHSTCLLKFHAELTFVNSFSLVAYQMWSKEEIVLDCQTSIPFFDLIHRSESWKEKKEHIITEFVFK